MQMCIRDRDVSVWWNRLCDNVLSEKTMPFDLLTVLPTRLDLEVNGFNGGVLNGVPSAYHLSLIHIYTRMMKLATNLFLRLILSINIRMLTC